MHANKIRKSDEVSPMTIHLGSWALVDAGLPESFETVDVYVDCPSSLLLNSPVQAVLVRFKIPQAIGAFKLGLARRLQLFTRPSWLGRGARAIKNVALRPLPSSLQEACRMNTMPSLLS
ncbi:hypothetical protein HGRIS_005922 [Hohenbuehelia grisea]|uniref:Uncharacterized protein n=1 Tax=Hohenbuehelia grisea TaxID=104357 RepID=A0ABR3K0N5_9AGAR